MEPRPAGLGADMTDEDESSGVKSERWSWLALPAILFNLLSNIFSSFENAFDNLTTGLVCHMKWRREQRAFHESVSRDIETLTS